ncbi:MAG: sulfur carrier protein ThiS adenylyltransferase ThiF [Desulfarculales bacterium]|jgi:sulfur carrier protein ThiS adenylyltransferase|nr:sulfur carrier protein ThiS adenylyltransferase ThiF [Desulfarculales bacterium]
MEITVNGRRVNTDSLRAGELAGELAGQERVILLRRGFALEETAELAPGDELQMIPKDRLPGRLELEAMLTARHTPGTQACFKAGRVAVAGLGGLGSHIALALARSGVGSLLLADFDVVDASNLNRQAYFVSHLGQPKAPAMAELIRDVNPYVETQALTLRLDRHNIPHTLKGWPIIVEAFDRPDCKAELVNTALAAFPQCRVVCASGLADMGSANLIRTRRLTSRLYLCGDEVSGAREGRGLMAPRVMICAGHQANMVLRLLLEMHEA